MPASTFSVQNRQALRELFQLLNVPFFDTDPATNAKAAEELWITEHRQINATHSDDELRQVLPIAKRMGMLGESLPTTHELLDRMNNPGGTVRAMIKRVRLYERLETEGNTLGSFLCWAGQRLRELKTGETLPELIAFVEHENPSVLADTWFREQLALDDENPDRYLRPLATETEIMILCAKVVYGDQLALVHTELTDERSAIEGVPDRKILYYVFSRSGRPDIIVLNGAAVERTNGKQNRIDPRPTLTSTAVEVRAVFGFAGKQGFMASNPHSLRLTLEAERVAGAPFTVYSLPEPEPADQAAEVKLAKTVLGEVARTLRLEVKYGLV